MRLMRKTFENAKMSINFAKNVKFLHFVQKNSCLFSENLQLFKYGKHKRTFEFLQDGHRRIVHLRGICGRGIGGYVFHAEPECLDFSLPSSIQIVQCCSVICFRMTTLLLILTIPKASASTSRIVMPPLGGR